MAAARTLGSFGRGRLTLRAVSRGLAGSILIAAAIVGCGWISSAYVFLDRYESLLYLPAGLIFAVVLRFGFWSLLPAWFGLVALALVDGTPVVGAALDATAEVLAQALAAALFGRHLRLGLEQRPMHTLLAFYAYGLVLLPTTHALLELPLLVAQGGPSASGDLRATLFAFILGDALGVLVLAPLVYFWGRDFRHFYEGEGAVYPRESATEKLVWISLFLATLGFFLIYGKRALYAGMLDLAFVLFPMLLWAALRLGAVFTHLVVAAAALAVFTFAAFGVNGTPQPRTFEELIALVVFVLVAAMLAQTVADADLERRLKALALRRSLELDALTGSLTYAALANRIDRAGTGGVLAAVALDRLDELQRGLGFATVANVLRRAARAIATTLGEQAGLARVGAGDFVAWLPDLALEPALERLEAARTRLTELAFEWGEVRLSPRPGVAALAFDGDLAAFDETVARVVDSASKAREERLGEVVRLERPQAPRTMQLRLVRRTEIERALEEGRFHLYAQPIFALPVAGSAASTERRCEVLLRYENAGGEVLPFLAIQGEVERLQMMPEIDRWVIRNTFEWLERHCDHLPHLAEVAINLTGSSLDQPRFADALMASLGRLRFPAERLCFEITERSAIGHHERVVDLIVALKERGCRISLDDFGTGLSSFEYLKRLPVDYVKIDGLFVRGIDSDPANRAVVTAIHGVARSMGRRTIAEFVESAAILSVLEELGLDFAQGYHLGCPEPLERLLEASKKDPL